MEASYVKRPNTKQSRINPPPILSRHKSLTVPSSPIAPVFVTSRYSICCQGIAINPGRLSRKKLLAVVMLEQLNAWRKEVGAEKLCAIVSKLGNLGF